MTDRTSYGVLPWLTLPLEWKSESPYGRFSKFLAFSGAMFSSVNSMKSSRSGRTGVSWVPELFTFVKNNKKILSIVLETLKSLNQAAAASVVSWNQLVESHFQPHYWIFEVKIDFEIHQVKAKELRCVVLFWYQKGVKNVKHQEFQPAKGQSLDWFLKKKSWMKF